MHLLHTDENFGSLPAKEKIELIKGLANGTIQEVTDPGLQITVLADDDGNYSLLPDGETINLSEWRTLQNYLEAKYPLSKIYINEVKAGYTNTPKHKAA